MLPDYYPRFDERIEILYLLPSSPKNISEDAYTNKEWINRGFGYGTDLKIVESSSVQGVIRTQVNI